MLGFHKALHIIQSMRITAHHWSFDYTKSNYGKSTSRETVYCYFVDFKKAFDTVPRSELWKRMIEIRMQLDYEQL